MLVASRAHVNLLLCTPHSTSTSGYGLSNGCLNQVWLEYLSFALILGGAIVATIAFMLLKRGRTAHREAGRPSSGSSARRESLLSFVTFSVNS